MTAIKKRSAYAAAAHVLRAPTLSWVVDGKLNDDREFIMWEDIDDRYGSLSGGEQTLVDIAHAIWSGGFSAEPTLSQMMTNVDDGCWERVIEALLALRPLPTVRAATEIADEAIGMFLERADAAGICHGEDYEEWAARDDLKPIRAEAVQEIREGMAVREEDLR
jgi:hypothetical protein